MALALVCVTLFAACSSGGGHVQEAGGQAVDPATVDFPIFYIKRYAIPANQDDLRQLRQAVLCATPPCADLFMRTQAAPDGTELNITQRITGTGTAKAASYDVKDVTVSADGKTILFAMRGPLTAKMQQDKAPSWRIWQYVIASDTLSQVINPATDPDPLTVNDVAPQALPDGRVLFSSTRQRQSQAILLDEGAQQFVADDEARNEPAFVLHVMNADGSNIHQISFNQSHDRDAIVLMSGRVAWTRWDNAPGGTDGMHLYSANPDGTDAQLLYGANSHATGNDGTSASSATIEFVKTHEMADGRILALVRPFTGTKSATAPLGTDFGGDLVIIDTKNYVENTQPAAPDSSLAGPAQTRASHSEILTIPGPSPGGRFYAGFPLWDGTGRILVSWSQCRLLDTTATPNTIIPCNSSALADPNATAAPPLYSVWMFNPSTNTMQPIMLPTEGVMVTDLVAAQPRALPAVINDKVPGVDLDQDFYNNGVGVLNIRSVYDFDGVDSAKPNIPATADGKTPAAQRPARFIRLEKPVSLPNRKVLNLDQAAFGASGFMRQILGYAPIEPDGSVRIQVPANVAFQMSIVDANGQRISPIHTAWLQVRPGEELKCNGCHTPASAQPQPAPGQTARSHGRAGLFSSAYAGAAATGTPFPNSVATFSPNAGETMAETRSRTSCAGDTPRCAAMIPSTEVLYTDVWTNTAAGLTANPDISYSYADAANFTTAAPTPSACLKDWSGTCRIVINYTEHIQPLWDKLRQVTVNNVVTADHTCTQGGCHNPKDAQGNIQVPAGQLDLTNVASNDEPLQFVSYRKLLFTHNEQTVNMGVLQDVLVPGPIDPATGMPTQVTVGISPPAIAGDAHDSTRFFGRFAPGSGNSVHAGILSGAELRLMSEWLDIGAQYFNNPFDPTAPVN
jgi:hypothetical protein